MKTNNLKANGPCLLLQQKLMMGKIFNLPLVNAFQLAMHQIKVHCGVTEASLPLSCSTLLY